MHTLPDIISASLILLYSDLMHTLEKYIGTTNTNNNTRRPGASRDVGFHAKELFSIDVKVLDMHPSSVNRHALIIPVRGLLRLAPKQYSYKTACLLITIILMSLQSFSELLPVCIKVPTVLYCVQCWLQLIIQ